MATYGGTQKGTPRLVVNEDGTQDVVYDDIEVSPTSQHQSVASALGKTAGQIIDPRKSALPYILGAIAAPSVAGLFTGGAPTAAAASSVAPNVVAPTVAGGAKVGLGAKVAGLFGKGAMGKLATGGKVLGGILDAQSENRDEANRNAIYQDQIAQRGAEGRENSVIERAKLEREDLAALEKARNENYLRALRSERTLNYTPMEIDASGFRTKPNIPKATGGRTAAPSEAERQVLTQIRDQALREAMNPTRPAALPEYQAAQMAGTKGPNWLERLAGPAALGMRLFGANGLDDETQIRRPVAVGDAPHGGNYA